MRVMTFTNSRGESLSFRAGSNFQAGEISGLGDTDSDVQVQRSPFQDGSTFVDSLLTERLVSWNATIRGVSDTDISEKRSLLARVFNPKLGMGTLKYQYGDIVREIKATPEHIPMFPTGRDNRSRAHQTAVIDMICPNPYWRSLEMTEQPTFEALFQFPFEGEFQMGVQRDERIIDNDGDSPAPLFIEFNGPASNPQIINNTTGEYFKVNQTLGEGEVMEIDTEAATVFFVESDGTKRNVFNWIDDDAVFFKLALGENQIEYTADSDIQGAIVNISYSKLYTAV